MHTGRPQLERDRHVGLLRHHWGWDSIMRTAAAAAAATAQKTCNGPETEGTRLPKHCINHGARLCSCAWQARPHPVVQCLLHMCCGTGPARKRTVQSCCEPGGAWYKHPKCCRTATCTRAQHVVRHLPVLTRGCRRSRNPVGAQAQLTRSRQTCHLRHRSTPGQCQAATALLRT